MNRRGFLAGLAALATTFLPKWPAKAESPVTYCACDVHYHINHHNRITHKTVRWTVKRLNKKPVLPVIPPAPYDEILIESVVHQAVWTETPKGILWLASGHFKYVMLPRKS